MYADVSAMLLKGSSASLLVSQCIVLSMEAEAKESQTES